MPATLCARSRGHSLHGIHCFTDCIKPQPSMGIGGSLAFSPEAMLKWGSQVGSTVLPQRTWPRYCQELTWKTLCLLLNIKNSEAFPSLYHPAFLFQSKFLFERECRHYTEVLCTLYPAPPVVTSYKTTGHNTTRELSLMWPRLRTFPSARDACIAKSTSLPPHRLLFLFLN